jgi:beta-galactosidase/beta-glucuronidase
VVLDGLWRFRRDPQAQGMDKGFQQGRFSGPLVRVPWVPDARRIAGPPGVANFRGTVGWYRTNFVVPAAGRYAIRFESVNHKAQVFVDGRRVATNVGEYLPFEAQVDLTPGVVHKLVVRADWRNPNQMKRDGWHRLWFNFGGINRPVTIRPVGPSDLMHPALRTRLEADGSALVSLQVHVRNNGPYRQIAARGTLRRDGRTIDVAFPAEAFAQGQIKVLTTVVRVPDPALWSPRAPQLWDYDIEVPGESSYRARVGLRELRARGRTLLLNGREIRLRGASIHEDVYGRGDALLPADQDRIVAGLKAISANATRSQHPIDPGLLERFDAAGIMVWQGVGPTDSPGNFTARTPAKVRVAKERVRRTLRQAQLHPSIITWNLANEVAGDGHPTGQAPYIDSMAVELKRRDPSRPVALDIWGAHPPKRPSLMYRNIDMIGWTNYIGWYESTDASAAQLRREIRSRLAQIRRVFPEKVIAVTEFGAEGNGRNATTAPGGYAFQSHLIDLHLATYARIPHLAGALVWNLRDFAVAPSFAGGSITRVVPGIKLVRGVNQKGLYNLRNQPKPSAAAAASRFEAQAAADGG